MALKKVVAQMGKTLRFAGQSVDKIGAGFEGRLAYTEHCKYLCCIPIVESSDDPSQ